MSSVAICHISGTWNTNFDSIKGFEDTSTISILQITKGLDQDKKFAFSDKT